MNGTSPVTLRWPSLIAGALVLLAVGAGLMYVMVRRAPATGAPASSVAPASMSGTSLAVEGNLRNDARSDVSVTLTPDAIQRAGIVVASVVGGAVVIGGAVFFGLSRRRRPESEVE